LRGTQTVTSFFPPPPTQKRAWGFALLLISFPLMIGIHIYIIKRGIKGLYKREETQLQAKKVEDTSQSVLH